MQHQYWVTKKAVQRKLGGKEDQHIVSSDAELDSKIELFKSISESCISLHRVIDHFQERLCILASEENNLGKFLKENGKNSVTTGKVMNSAGKAISYCGQQRMMIRAPLVRLHHEVETFRGRAIADTKETMSVMERERTEYRAALSWMKSASGQLDPDSGKGLDKFRKAQNHVRLSKAKFDRMTLDCLQKIDLLAAARCNMFSHALVAYQQALTHFFTKTTEAFDTASKALTNEPHYSFAILKDLTQAERGETATDTIDGGDSINAKEKPIDTDQMLFFQDEYKDEKVSSQISSTEVNKPSVPQDVNAVGNTNLIDIPKSTESNEHLLNSVMDLALDPSTAQQYSTSTDLLGLNNNDFGDFVSAQPFMPSQLLLNTLAGFEMPQAAPASDEKSTPEQSANKNSILDLFNKIPKTIGNKVDCDNESKTDWENKKTPVKSNKDKIGRKDMSAWFHLFAELDPLANPDMIEKKLDGNFAQSNSHAA